jgi:hypothetical protein
MSIIHVECMKQQRSRCTDGASFCDCRFLDAIIQLENHPCYLIAVLQGHMRRYVLLAVFWTMVDLCSDAPMAL